MRVKICGLNNPEGFFCVSDLGYVSKITKAQFRRLDLHILVEKPRRSTTAPVFFVSICKPIQQNCIFQTLETQPSNSARSASNTARRKGR
jgi:hypothetical protein